MCMEKSLEEACVGLQVGWGISGNHQGLMNSDSQVDEDSDMVPACWLCGDSEKEQWPLPTLLSGRKLLL